MTLRTLKKEVANNGEVGEKEKNEDQDPRKAALVHYA
jgi:hypothetical protein